jgi:hypothetical protein
MPGGTKRAAASATGAASAARRSVRPKKSKAVAATPKITSAQRELNGAPSYRAGPAKKGPPGKVLPGTHPLPKRNAKGELVFADHPELRPNLTPKEVMQLGSFGGTCACLTNRAPPAARVHSPAATPAH